MKSFTKVWDLAIEVWGSRNQLVVAMEELAELIQEIAKLNRDNWNRLEELEGEIADAELMIGQIKYMLNIDERRIERKKNEKITKLEKKLEKLIA